MSSSRTNVRWLTLALIVALIVINYIDRSAISYAVEPLTEAFGISKSQYGLISSAFSIGYMVFAFMAGPLVDRYGARRILLVGVAIWSLVTAVTPIAGSFIGLFVTRIILGAGRGRASPRRAARSAAGSRRRNAGSRSRWSAVWPCPARC